MGYPHADLYDAVAIDRWDELIAIVAPALEPLASTTGVAVDLGAGTGLSTHEVAHLLPHAEVLACEPDLALRAALMTRVTSSGLRERVTVLPWTASELAEKVAEPIGVFTAFNMLGHLDTDERRALWAWLGRWLAADGVAVLGPVAAHDASQVDVDAEGEEYVVSRVGRRTYHSGARPEIRDDRSVTWHMWWRVYEGEMMVEERAHSIGWQRIGLQETLDEVRSAGLEVARSDNGLLVLTNPKTGT